MALGLDEESLIPVSALEHWSYCPRQCGLILLDNVFEENIFTMRGKWDHEAVDEPDRETRPEGVVIERALPLWSARLGLVGRADVVEFRDGVPYPVEYKHGSRRRHPHAALQLCAQAMCLEEMLGIAVPRGAIYHISSRRRQEVGLDAPLRDRVEEAAREIRDMIRRRFLPAPANDGRCKNCSLIDACVPDVITQPDRLREYRRLLWETE